MMIALIGIATVGMIVCPLYILINFMPPDFRRELFGYGPIVDYWQSRMKKKR